MDEQTKTNKKRKSGDTLHETIISTQRKEIERLESKIRGNEQTIRTLENNQARLERRAVASEDDAEALLNATRVLAAVIPPDTAQGRKVRQEARQLLEKRKISPPSTLGSSRNRRRGRS